MDVSVVIPCFNSAEHLPRCLDSILAQRIPVREIICIDDGSTDNTIQILRQYEAKHQHLFKIVQQEKSGAGKARKRGLEMAQGT